MALPKIETPTYHLTLPSTGEKIKYRPFLVKEEKILLIATESEEDEAIQNAIKDIISNCTFGKLDPDDSTPFDIEWVFLQLRIKSKGETVDLNYTCNNNIDKEDKEKVCGASNLIHIDLRDIKIDTENELSKVIHITDTIGVEMMYPTFKTMEMINPEANGAEQAMAMIVSNITTVFEGDVVYCAGQDFDVNEMSEFVDNLSEEQFSKIREFFDGMPTVKHDVEYNCTTCGYKETLHLEGLQDFLM
jgi:hypothetical protein